MDALAATSPDLAGPGSLGRALLDALPQGGVLVGEDGTVLHANAAEERLLGFGPGELRGRSLLALSALPPAEARARLLAMGEALRSRGSWDGEWWGRRRDGTGVPGRLRVSRVAAEGAGAWLCLREEAGPLGDGERARLDLALEAGRIGLWDWEPGSEAICVSGRVREIFGLEPGEEVAPKGLEALIHPEDRAAVEAQYRRALDPGRRESEPVEFRVLRRDGEMRWVLSSGAAVFEDGPEGPRAVRYLGALQDITERRAIEEAQRKAVRRLRLAMEAGRMAVWETEVATGRIAGSAELNRLLGFPEDEPLDPAAVRARHAPGERERMAAAGLAAMARGEGSFEDEFRYLRAPDDPRWLRLRCDILFDAEGRPERAIGVVFDETDRRRAEEELRASEARLQLASAALGAGVWDRDLLTGEVVWSPKQFALLGLDPATPPEGLPAAWWDAVLPEDATRLAGRIAAIERDGGATVEDFRVRPPGGGLRWIRMHATAVPGPDGRPERVVGIEIDVTAEHERAEALEARNLELEGEVEERRREQGRFHALSQDLFSVTDFEGRFRSVNPVWTRLLGWTEEELLSRPLLDFIHPDDHAMVMEEVGRILGGASMQGFTDRLLAKDGRVLWVEWAGVPENGLFYAVGRDITREREREEVLRQAQKMDALGQLTGGIAHDFNNLLQALQGSLALIARRPEDPARVRMLAEEGMQAARRGATLTSQLLAFSRSGALDLRPVGVKGLLEGMGDLLRRSLGPLVEVAMELPAEEVAARADATQLEMAVLNLAINARDAMEGGGAIRLRVAPVEVGADPELAPGGYVLLEVADSGPGMAPEVIARAFEPFFTTKGVGRGTGLGLSQVYAMARQAGGSARIESAPGRGATVRLWLPRAAAAAGGEAPVRRDALRAARSLRVLVVDDDDDVRRWLVEAVRSLGHEVLEAADGPAGIAALEGGPDLAILDYAMPGMTGAELALALRARRPDLPIVLATGHADFAALPAGHRVLRKPFELGDLEAALAEVAA